MHDWTRRFSLAFSYHTHTHTICQKSRKMAFDLSLLFVPCLCVCRLNNKWEVETLDLEEGDRERKTKIKSRFRLLSLLCLPQERKLFLGSVRYFISVIEYRGGYFFLGWWHTGEAWFTQGLFACRAHTRWLRYVCEMRNRIMSSALLSLNDVLFESMVLSSFTLSWVLENVL